MHSSTEQLTQLYFVSNVFVCNLVRFNTNSPFLWNKSKTNWGHLLQTHWATIFAVVVIASRGAGGRCTGQGNTQWPLNCNEIFFFHFNQLKLICWRVIIRFGAKFESMTSSEHSSSCTRSTIFFSYGSDYINISRYDDGHTMRPTIAQYRVKIPEIHRSTHSISLWLDLSWFNSKLTWE